MNQNRFQECKNAIRKEHEALLSRSNDELFSTNGIFNRYKYPVLTRDHFPMEWRYDFNPETNPFFMERIGFNAAFNAGAIKWKGKYLLAVRGEGNDRKSFFAIAESPNGVDNFRFWERPLTMPETEDPDTNVYDIRLTEHEDGFIDTGKGGGIAFGLSESIVNGEVKEEQIMDAKTYHTIYELKNGQGPAPIKTEKGWLNLAHGVRNCAAGLRYTLYMFMTALDDPSNVIHKPSGLFMGPLNQERVGDVSNVLFTNGWIADDDGRVFIYYASSDTRMHLATSTIDQLVDYCINTPEDRLRSAASVQAINELIDKNKTL